MNTEKINSLQSLKKALKTNEELKQKFKNDPLDALEQIEEHPLSSDKMVYRIVVGGLCAIILFVMISVLVLVLEEQDIPDVFKTSVSIALGALVGLLAPQPKTN
ncbi:MAG: hypothetical protein MI810_13645 [Flavobacteriales bacterium]|jgi:hypothetical protein|nr:hypothetical protein [Flavobacteriales bacterium]